MTVLSLPASMIPVRQRWQEEWKNIEMRSVFGSQILQPVPPVWATELEFDDRAEWLSGDIKALWMRLAGGNQLEAHYMGRPVPLGTMRGTLTLAADVAQGATSMQLVRANDNLLTFPEAFDNAAWAKTNATIAPNSATAPDGTATADKIIESAGASNNHFVSRPGGFPFTAGSQYDYSISAQAAGRDWLIVEAQRKDNTFPAVWFNLTTGAIGTNSADSASIVPEGGGWYRCSINFNSGVGATTGQIYLITSIGNAQQTYAGDGSSGVNVWGAKLKLGVSTPYGHNLTLLAGDFLGIGSGSKQQVVMVTQDATSTGQGNITVNFEHPLRNGFPAGTPVIWDKPKALFRLRQNRPGWEQERARVKGLKLDLIESVYA